MIVTIDGPAGVGKSTLAHALAQRRGFFPLPSGAAYRAVTYAALSAKRIRADGQPFTPHFDWLAGLELDHQGLLLNSEDISEQIHSPAVSQAVAGLSAFIQVRRWVNHWLRTIAQPHPRVVAEGRDMGSEVFPEAEVKVFLRAPLAVRIARCGDRGPSCHTESDLKTRDQLDYQKRHGKLRVAEGAEVFDVSNLTFEQVYDKLVNLLERATLSQQRRDARQSE